MNQEELKKALLELCERECVYVSSFGTQEMDAIELALDLAIRELIYLRGRKVCEFSSCNMPTWWISTKPLIQVLDQFRTLYKEVFMVSAGNKTRFQPHLGKFCGWGRHLLYSIF